MKPFNKKFNFFLLLIFTMSLLLFTALSCDSAEPFNQKTFQFSALETSCTEAWLKVISNDSETPKLKIKNGEQIIFDGILSTTDTIIYTD
ncbi:MAG: hypothetical protein K9G63_10180, partial [Melioribacteraceae bacterium]|nr:hypothetical protein [Melioribacteraceae bacterium]